MNDYHDFTDIDTPLPERRRLGVGDVWINSAECRKCGETIRSRGRHDYVTCSCGAISVDGGSWYCRSTGKHEDFIGRYVSFTEIEE